MYVFIIIHGSYISALQGLMHAHVLNTQVFSPLHGSLNDMHTLFTPSLYLISCISQTLGI